MVNQVHLELARLAAAASPTPERARDMLLSLGQLVPFDAAWVATTHHGAYLPLASTGLDASVVHYLSSPKTAQDIHRTGTDRSQPPLSPSDLPFPVEELQTWAESLIPAGIHEALAVALFEPGGRHVGFLALLSADRRPPEQAVRRRLGEVTGLLAQGIDPMRSLTAASGLVSGAFAGVLLFEDGRVEELPGLPGDDALAEESVLLQTIRTRLVSGQVHLSFLWPRGSSMHPPSPRHVRVTYLARTESTFPNLSGIVLLSPTGPLHQLTPRELEVLGMIVDGYSNRQIAARLVVTVRTVATHVEHILLKLASPSRTHAAVRAQREGLYVPIPDGATDGRAFPPER